MSETLLVAVPADVRSFENYRWHASPETYLSALARVAKVVPVIVPALSRDLDIEGLLDRVDGVLVTGSATNVHPSRYGVAETEGHKPFDLDRDALSQTMIAAALRRGVPLLAICRGHQELNVTLGGSLATEIQTQEGRMDHRAPEHPSQDERFAPRHPVSVVPDGLLASIVGTPEIQVNSLHRQGVERLAAGLTIEAEAADGTVEAVSVAGASAFALGVQWHPEYWAESDAASAAIFHAFAEACRARRTAAR